MGSQGGILSVKSPHKSSNLVDFPLKYSIEGQILNNSRGKEVLTWLANIRNIKSPLFLVKTFGHIPALLCPNYACELFFWPDSA
jgi:hypothetical protein